MSQTDTRTSTRKAGEGPSTKRLVALWARGTGTAIFVVAFLYAVADGMSGPLLVAEQTEVTLANVLALTAIGGTVGAILAYAAGRLATQPRRALLAVASIGLAGYAVVPFTAAETLETALWLNVFHLAVAVPVIWVLASELPRGRISDRA